MKILDSKKIPTPCTSNHGSNLLQLDNGDLLCTWFGGSMEGTADVCIYLARMDHTTGTWSQAQKMSADETRSEQNPALFKNSNNELWLLYTAQLKTDQGTAIVRLRKSKDNGQTWSEAEDLFSEPGTFIRHAPVINPAGNILLPVFHSSIKEAFGNDSSSVMISEDGGATWQKSPVPGSNGCVHMNILANCKVAFFRRRRADKIYRSVSEDDGLTWSVPQPTPLPNNNSSLQARLLKDGSIAVIYNHIDAQGRPCESSIPPWIQDQESFLKQCEITQRSAIWGVPRNPLVIATSDDFGMTWERQIIVEADSKLRSDHDEKGSFVGDYSYPSLIETADGNLQISYSYLRDYIKHVILSR